MISLATVWSGLGSLSKQLLTPPSLPALYFSQFQEWGRWEARRQRYDFNWAWWSNSVYDSAHLWSGQFKTIYDLYKYTRGTYNPMFRLGEFWATTLWGGHLRVEKQGGRVVQSAIPIITDDDAIRVAIGQLWKDSRWQVEKNIFARYGSVMGDACAKIEDSPEEGKVRIVPVNPQTLRWIQQDVHGRVLAYELWEPRWDPEYNAATSSVLTPGVGQQTVLYVERARLEGNDVIFETFRNSQPYNWKPKESPALEPYKWNGSAAKWSKPYGFIPLMLHPHIQMHTGYYWGASEYQTAWRKAIELDDLSSKQHDNIRMASNPKWFLAGVNAPRNLNKTVTIQGNDPSESNTGPGRAEEPFFYAGLGSTAVPMVFPIDNQFVSIEIQNQLNSLEKDYPELRYDSARVSGDASAKALREVRKSAEAKVHDRRSGYDSALISLQRMAIAMGGQAGYPGYEPFKEGAYLSGQVDHEIGERSVFLMDPLDRIEEEQALFTAWQTAKLAGWPTSVLMTRFDFSPDEVKSFEDAEQKERDTAVEHETNMAAAAPKPPPPAKGDTAA